MKFKHDARLLINKSATANSSIKRNAPSSDDNETYFSKHKILWLNCPQYMKDFKDVAEIKLQPDDRSFIFISGCSPKVASFLADRNFEIINVGKEALLYFDREHLNKRSLKELIRIGSRRGKITELKYSEDNKSKLEQFKLQCIHGREPQLKYFFNDKFLPGTRLFVLKNDSDKWLGGILLACIDDKRVRTDLILRRNNAPKGVMEALIGYIFNKLKFEGFESWSIGEVPYVANKTCFLSKDFFINFTGRRLRFAYNYIGLYNFKNKFSPEWQNTYVCCSPRMTLLSLIKISWISNMLKLIFIKSLKAISAN